MKTNFLKIKEYYKLGLLAIVPYTTFLGGFSTPVCHGKQYPVKEADPMGLEEKLSAPQLKKFAKLAPPRNKVTFADKIAGAKKEVDEMLGDVAADAMRSAVGHIKKKRTGEMDESWDDMMKDVKHS